MRLPGSPALSPSAGRAVGQALLLAVAPHGGQRAARRNAWTGMVADAQRARSRHEATEAMHAAIEAAAHGAATRVSGG